MADVCEPSEKKQEDELMPNNFIVRQKKTPPKANRKEEC